MSLKKALVVLLIFCSFQVFAQTGVKGGLIFANQSFSGISYLSGTKAFNGTGGFNRMGIIAAIFKETELSSRISLSGAFSYRQLGFESDWIYDPDRRSVVEHKPAFQEYLNNRFDVISGDFALQYTIKSTKFGQFFYPGEIA